MKKQASFIPYFPPAFPIFSKFIFGLCILPFVHPLGNPLVPLFLNSCFEYWIWPRLLEGNVL